MVNILIESPINYMGSKYKLLPQLIPLFPKNKSHFVDLFTGGGSVYINVNHLYEKVLANDIITDLIEIHKFLQDKDFLQEAKEYSIKTKSSKEEYLTLREQYNKTHNPAMLLALIWSCNSNMMRFNNDFIFNQTWGKRCFNKNTQKKWNKYSEKDYSNVIFRNMDFYELGMKVKDNAFVYLDCPYKNTEAGYNSFWSNKNEDDLIKLIHHYIKNDIKFGLSGVNNGKPNKVYDIISKEDIKVYKFGDLYQKISKKDKINVEYYITNI